MTFTDSMKTELAKPLDKKNVKPPAPGKYGEYVEGWKTIDEANRIFGFDGWSRETIDMIETSREQRDGKWFVSYRAKARVEAHGVVREGSAAGSGVSKSLCDAIESAIKEAETDAMKRALMTFGNPFGLALYDKTKANVDDGAPKPDPIDRPALILDLAKAAGVTIQTICESYNVASLNELPTAKADAVIKRLNLTIKDKENA
jgi:DNA repair and recombination protein RAD52